MEYIVVNTVGQGEQILFDPKPDRVRQEKQVDGSDQQVCTPADGTEMWKTVRKPPRLLLAGALIQKELLLFTCHLLVPP